MDLEQRVRRLEADGARLMGLAAGLMAAVATLIRTHPDQALIGRLLERTADLGLQTEGPPGGIGPYNHEFFMRALDALHQVASGREALDLRDAERVIRDILDKPAPGPA